MKKSLFQLLVQLLIFLFFYVEVCAQLTGKQEYIWKNVQIVGGGFVDGIVFHPKNKNVRYARTDMGGAYKWDASLNRWQPIMDWVSYANMNLMGVESIALDPKNADIVYLACGTYTSNLAPDGAILISKDGAKTFTRVNIPVKFGGNENGRGNGERMMVDPNYSNILYLGTRNAGLWKSFDAGLTWNKVATFPEITEQLSEEEKKNRWSRGCGINLVVYDSNQKTNEGSIVYVGVSVKGQNNFFSSADGGKTWKAIENQPIAYRPTHAVLASDGNMYITYGSSPGPSRMTNGAVWKFNLKKKEWTEISPIKIEPQATDGFGYAAVSVDMSSPKILIVSTFSKGKDGDEIFRSTDRGTTWKSIFSKESVWDAAKAPYTAHTPPHWMFDIEIDPFNPSHAIFTTGYGGWETFNLKDIEKGKPVNWQIMSTGIEETVGLDLCSPTKGAQLFSAIGDYCGFRHVDLDKPVAEGCYTNSHFANTNSISCAENNPDVLIRSGRASGHQRGKNFSYSLDGGITWKDDVNLPSDKFQHGFVALSADGSNWIWTPERENAYQTSDNGGSWTKIIGIPQNTRVIADRVNSKKFYAMDLFGGKLFTSTDGGLNFSEKAFSLPDGLPQNGRMRGDKRGGQDCIYATPGKEGDLWIAAFNGLYHSENSGELFARLPNVEQILGFGFGKSAEGRSFPALYLIGTISAQPGIFRSNDAGATWVRINDDAHQWGLLLQITGDPKKYGRVYVGTHGRGIIYGDVN